MINEIKFSVSTLFIITDNDKTKNFPAWIENGEQKIKRFFCYNDELFSSSAHS